MSFGCVEVYGVFRGEGLQVWKGGVLIFDIKILQGLSFGGYGIGMEVLVDLGMILL